MQHVQADAAEEEEGDPVVERLNEVAEQVPDAIAQCRGSDGAGCEDKGDLALLLALEGFFKAGALAEGGGEGIHRQTNGEHEEGEKGFHGGVVAAMAGRGKG